MKPNDSSFDQFDFERLTAGLGGWYGCHCDYDDQVIIVSTPVFSLLLSMWVWQNNACFDVLIPLPTYLG